MVPSIKNNMFSFNSCDTVVVVVRAVSISNVSLCKYAINSWCYAFFSSHFGRSFPLEVSVASSLLLGETCI